jgi:hypothetical protein
MLSSHAPNPHEPKAGWNWEMKILSSPIRNDEKFESTAVGRELMKEAYMSGAPVSRARVTVMKGVSGHVMGAQ